MSVSFHSPPLSATLSPPHPHPTPLPPSVQYGKALPEMLQVCVGAAAEEQPTPPQSTRFSASPTTATPLAAPSSSSSTAFQHWLPTTEPAASVCFSSETPGHRFAVCAWGRALPEQQVSASGVFGFALEDAVLCVPGLPRDELPLRRGMYFVAPGGARVKGGAGFLVAAHDYSPILLLGGPIEERGRLPYIDGCTDSLLLAPLLYGDPCFNHLHFPQDTAQTQHTHPSARVGAVVRGAGVCIHVDEQGTERQTELTPGVVFVIPADALHSFHTTVSSLDVVAWHPDSDFGPQADDHPMVNKTIVSGVSAAKLPKIRTRIDATISSLVA